ncbi:type II secretion system GspH family protein [Myxococcota bacterium]|nr:type II secretion system GspH family protein [Myxococcota bacterium]
MITLHVSLSGKKQGNKGFTLIEILIVMVILGLIVSGVAFYFRAIPKMQMKESTRKFASAIRFVASHARTTKAFHRIILDLDAQDPSVELEILPTGEVLPDLDPQVSEDIEEIILYEEWPEYDPSKAAGPTGSADKGKPFRPKSGGWKKPEKKFMQSLKLKGLHIKRVTFPCIGKEYDGGKVALHFFPNGQNFGAVIEMTGPSGSPVTMMVHAATAQVKFIESDMNFQSMCWDDQGRPVEKPPG